MKRLKVFLLPLDGDASPSQGYPQHCENNIYYMASTASGQDESNLALWLATRAGKMELSCPLGTTRRVPQEKFNQKPYTKSFIDQVCSVKMAGCWSRSFLESLWTTIQPSWPHTWSLTHTYTAVIPPPGVWVQYLPWVSVDRIVECVDKETFKQSLCPSLWDL